MGSNWTASKQPLASTRAAAQEPDSHEKWRPQLNDRSQIAGTEEHPNWASSGNDCSGEIDKICWLAANGS